MSPDSKPGFASIERKKREAVDVATQVVNGEVGIIAGSRVLLRLGHELVPDTRVDPDFVVFLALDSETDHLPLEDERHNWEPAAFAQKQLEVARLEELSRPGVVAACRAIIDRFGGG
jgi:hypothetical protein